MASCFTSLMGQPRIFYRMAQDGLWFEMFANVDPVTRVPRDGIMATGIVTALLACFVPLEALASLISLGTLMVFTFVDVGVILLRLRNVMESPAFKQSMEDGDNAHREALRRKNTSVTLLLLTFTISITVASMILSNSESKMPIYVLLVVAVSSAIATTMSLSSWKATEPTGSQRSVFSCPMVPVIPLGGVACNCFMMGSLPVISWFFCLIWLACGISIYFLYGIHHSTLGLEQRHADTIPLLGATNNERGAVDNGYETNLNMSLKPMKHIT